MHACMHMSDGLTESELMEGEYLLYGDNHAHP